jgi:hypothetical protein
MLGDLLGALTGDQGNNSNQPPAGQAPLSSLLGGLLGGQSGGGQDSMSQLLGGLMGGASQNQAAGQSDQLGSVLGMLEGVMGAPAGQAAQSGTQGGNAAADDPVMQMLAPLVDRLAAKMNISPQVAMTVVTFVAHQLLSSHPASGRTSMIDPGALQAQLNSGQGVSHDYLHSSGLVNQLVQQTGLDPQTASKSLKTVFDMLGQG